MNASRERLLKRLPALFEIPAPDADRALRRIQFMEREVMLLVKLVFIGIVLHSFHYSLWMGQVSSTLDVTVETVQLVFGFYIAVSAALAVPLFFAKRLPLAVLPPDSDTPTTPLCNLASASGSTRSRSSPCTTV